MSHYDPASGREQRDGADSEMNPSYVSPKPAATGSGEPQPNNGLSFQEYEQWTPESAEVMLSRETLRRLYEHARHEIGCPHLNENLTSNTDCNCGWYEIETEVLATLRMPTPPASQPTVRETFDKLREAWQRGR